MFIVSFGSSWRHIIAETLTQYNPEVLRQVGTGCSAGEIKTEARSVLGFTVTPLSNVPEELCLKTAAGKQQLLIRNNDGIILLFYYLCVKPTSSENN